MEQAWNEYVMFLWKAFKYDIDVFSSVWMYIPLLIPIFFYMFFFVLKWWFLTLPLTIPLNALLRLFGYNTYWPFKIVTEKYKNRILSQKLENEKLKQRLKENNIKDVN